MKSIKHISIKNFTKNGRFGNQIFQYAFAVYSALLLNKKLGVLPWDGDKFFEHKSLTHFHLPTFENVEIYKLYCEKYFKIDPSFDTEYLFLNGYFQHASFYENINKSLFQNIFETKKEISALFENKLPIHNFVVCHLRYGDYGYGYFYKTKLSWLESWLEQNMTSDALLYIATDEPKRVRTKLQKYHPIYAHDLSIKVDLGYYTDHYVMQQANILLMANSSFSFSAALLNRRENAIFYRPSLQQEKFILSAPWEEEALLNETNAETQFRLKHLKFHFFLNKIERRLDKYLRG